MKLSWRSWRTALVVPAAAALALSSCGDDSGTSGGSSVATAGTGGQGSQIKIAAAFSGSVTDGDYNALGLTALKKAESDFGAETTYTENTTVPDAERVLQEYVANGYNVVWTHGSQYYEATAKVAKQYPDVTFIGEFDAEPADPLPNVWVIDRNFHMPFYPIGALAALATKSGKIGYVGGLSLPFSYSEVHAMQQAIKDLGSDAVVNPVWTGDFNDPAKAQQITTQLMGQGNDVIVGSLNLGMVGVFNATKSRPAGAVVVTAKYTDKSKFDPQHYATSALYDFTKPLTDILTKLKAGEKSGYYPLGFDTGVSIQDPQNVDASVKNQVDQIVADIKSGKVTVKKDSSPIK